LTFVGPGEQTQGLPVRLFKLLLAEDALAGNNAEVWGYATSIINESGVLAGGEELVGRYLAGIWQHAYESVGEPLQPGSVRTVIAYPSIIDGIPLASFWNAIGVARGIAGFGGVTLIREHHAAAASIEQDGHMVSITLHSRASSSLPDKSRVGNVWHD
jgi:hypothetical protein